MTLYYHLSSLNSSLSTSQLADIWVTEEEVIDAIGCLTPHKSDSSGISTDLLRNTAPVVSECVAALFTAIMPKYLRDSVYLSVIVIGPFHLLLI